VPSFLQDHFQLNDFTPFHDEIRKITSGFLVGKYITAVPAAISSALDNLSLGIFHSDPSGNIGFYYMLTRTDMKTLPTETLLKPFLDVYLPDGLSLTFDEEMVGWYFEGATTPPPGDLTIADLIPTSGKPGTGVDCKFDVKMTARDINEFIDAPEHEAQMQGSITFAKFLGEEQVSYVVDSQNSRFNYLEVNLATGEAEMRYHLVFSRPDGRRFYLEGRKYMQKDSGDALRGMPEVLWDYTTLYCHIYEVKSGQADTQVGLGYLKFKTFEDLAAVGNLVGFVGSFQVTGTNDPVIQMQARMRFLAFTAQFVQITYDPLAPGTGS
jgi:hypothetical protein